MVSCATSGPFTAQEAVVTQSIPFPVLNGGSGWETDRKELEKERDSRLAGKCYTQSHLKLQVSSYITLTP